MPQFDFSQAGPQILWLALVFGALYLIVRGLLPKVQRVVENRAERIAADLREAEAARDAAEAATSGGSSALAEARGRSMTVTGKAREAAAAATAQKLADADAALAASAEAAARQLAAQRAEVVAELDRVASSATVELVQRVSGLAVSEDEAADAVRKVAA
jgi:F-type H+-transporting ATPase subunit b